MTLRVALLGYGRIARLVHLSALERLPGVEVVAVAELDPTRRAQGLRRVPGARGYADWAEALAAAECDAVVVCLPNALHAEAAAAAFRTGKHVYLEKPLATDAEGAERALAAWRESGRVGMIGFNYRVNALVEAARARLSAGRIGEVVGMATVFSAAERELPEWKRRRASGGGALLDKGSHHVDLVHHLLGLEVREVFGTVWSKRTEDDNAALTLRLEGGALVQSLFSLSSADADRLEVHGGRGRLELDRLRSLDVRVDLPDADGSPLGRLAAAVRAAARGPYGWRRILRPASESSYAAALGRFAAAALAGRPARPDLWDGWRSLRVLLAAEESARAGRPVALPELADADPPRP
ncbi:MAG TPA: Gfo/Idh/MocA family oxidoreductase [Gemmatimonadota bacterium]|jgi:predicted dehydrogenase